MYNQLKGNESKYWGMIILDKVEKILQQILENQLFMQNQMNKVEEKMGTMEEKMGTMEEKMGIMDEKMGTMEEKMGTMEKKIGIMDEKIDSNHKEVMERLDGVEKRLSKVEGNQDAIKRFMMESDLSFRRNEETYRVIQDLKNVFTKED